MTKTQISDEEQAVLLELLTIHYRDGVPLQTLFVQEGAPSSATYYRWREAFDIQFGQIDQKARERAATQRHARMSEFEASHELANANARQQAAGLMMEGMNRVAQIIRQEHVRDVYLDAEGEEKVRVKHIYPRDVLQAMKLLQEIARDGVVPEIGLPQTALPSTQLQLPARVDFTRMRLEKADGSGVEVRRLSPFDVIDETE